MANLKELFPEFYQDKLALRDLSNSSKNIVVLDTNFLLDILQLPTNISKKYIEALEKVQDIIYVPYLVALEFNFRKSTIKKEKRHSIKKYKDNIENSISKMKENINKIDLINMKDEKEIFTKELLTATEKYSKDLNKLVDQKIRKSITQEEEQLYTKLIGIIENKIGEKYEQNWIDEIEKIGGKRYEKGFPPGFDDQIKDNEEEAIRYYGDITYQRKFADLIIWKDIINYAKNSNLNGKKVVFVTNDGQSKSKRDLLYKVKDLIVGPNIFLMNELQNDAQKEFHILSNLRFIQLVTDLSDAQVRELESISEKKYMLKIPFEEIPEVVKKIEELNHKNLENEYWINEEGYLCERKKDLFNSEQYRKMLRDEELERRMYDREIHDFESRLYSGKDYTGESKTRNYIENEYQRKINPRFYSEKNLINRREKKESDYSNRLGRGSEQKFDKMNRRNYKDEVDNE